MTKLIVRIVINAVAFYVAFALLSPEYLEPETTNWVSYLWLALIFGLVNALLRPILLVMSCPLLILTLGLGTILINMLLFVLAGWIGAQFGAGFEVNGFIGAFLGSLVVSVVSFVLSLLLPGDLRK